MESTRVVFTQPGMAQLQTRELPPVSGDKVLVKTEYTVVSGGAERAYLLGMPNTRQVFLHRCTEPVQGILWKARLSL